METPDAFDRRLFMKRVSALPLLGYFAAQGMFEKAVAAVRRNPKDNIYTRIGVRPVINARGTWTYISGSIYYSYYGDEFKVECPTGSGQMMNLYQVAQEISRRLERIFEQDEHGRRPVFSGAEKFQIDPNWRDHILFYEYFHGDNGAGLGASHQTGWTGLVALLYTLFGLLTPEALLAPGILGEKFQISLNKG